MLEVSEAPLRRMKGILTLSQIITEQQPFGNQLSNTQVVFQMQEPKKLRPSRPEGVSDAVWGLITDCWAQESEKRPGIEEIVSRLEGIMKGGQQ